MIRLRILRKRYLCVLTENGLGSSLVTKLCRNLCKMYSTEMSRRAPSITVSPEEALIDEKLSIQVSGLEENQPITIQASLTENNARFASCASYSADKTGTVDLSINPALRGTFTGLEPMGLFWSMIPSPGQQPGLRLMKKDATTPYYVELKVLPGDISWDELYKNSHTPIASTEIKRWFKSKNVRRLDIREDNVIGTLFLPPGSGPFMGVIEMFGSAGGLLEYRAALLASRGFATLALSYFMFENLPKELSDIDLNYFKNAAKWFSRQSYVRPGGIGVVGVSLGGTIGKLMAIHCPEVRAVVSINGSPFLMFNSIKHGDDTIEAVNVVVSKVAITNDGIVIKNAFPFEKRHLIEVWRSDKKVLAIVGADDQNTNPEWHQALFDTYPDDKKEHFTIARYPHTGHLIEPPYTPFCRASYHRVVDREVVWGGQPKQHSDAQEDAWRRLQEFLRVNLSDRERLKQSML